MAKGYRKRVLVTGGAGFLGSHLCERLLAEEHDVLCVDNFYTGTKDNIARLLDNPNFEVMRHDVTFPLYVEVDEIYNLACPASPAYHLHSYCCPPGFLAWNATRADRFQPGSRAPHAGCCGAVSVYSCEYGLPLRPATLAGMQFIPATFLRLPINNTSDIDCWMKELD